MVEKQEKKLNELSHFVRFYLFPIFIVIFFVGTVLFFIIPQINKVSSNLSEVSTLQGDLKTREDNLAKIIQISNNQQSLKELVNKIEQLVPTKSTEVVGYTERIKDIATKSGIKITNIRAGENIRDTLSSTAGSTNPALSSQNSLDLPLHIIEVPTDLSAEGEIDKFKTFLSNLYGASDFFVVQKMSITDSGKKNTWKAEFSIVKYQFSGKIDIGSDVSQFLNQIPDKTVLDFFQAKFGGTQ